MNPILLGFLQVLMLVIDGIGIFASFDRMKFYQTGKEDRGVYPIYIMFMVLFAVFMTLTLSDLCVILDAPIWWAKLPIIRGHAFRLPITIVLLWMIHNQHAK